MDNILSLLETASNGQCYKSFKYCADEELRIPTLNYEDNLNFTLLKDKYGETDKTLKTTKSLELFAKKIAKDKPLFQFFLDGSRRTYKVDDIEINRRIFPIMAGQIAVACCERQTSSSFKCRELESKFVLCIPNEGIELNNSNLFLTNLSDKINQLDKIKKTGLKFSKVLSYKSKKLEGSEDSSKYENLGIAAIQDEMIDNEKRIVSNLTNKNLLNDSNYLIKDGSIQYKPMETGDYKELNKIKNNYRWVVGVSKMFNPEFSRDRQNKSNAAALASLPLYHRTPAYMHEHINQQKRLGNFRFSIWYVRIRDRKHTESPFAGIVKIEKILITENEFENGLESDLVDLITANVINERNPVCYGKDNRWANHLYPVYLTEQFLKSKYLSDIHFLNLF